jgi:hypothetical protein
MDSPELADVFLHEVVRHRGLPSSIVSDRDAKFMCSFWSNLCAAMEIKQRPSAPFHPQTNGQSERTNQTLKQILRTLSIAALRRNPQEPVSWIRFIDLVEIAINSAPLAGTELSPFYLNLGYHPTFFFDLPFTARNIPLDLEPAERPIGQFLHQLRQDWHQVKTVLLRDRMRALEQGNRRRAHYQFHVGQDVLVNQRRHHREQLGPIGPLLPQSAGPFRIRRQITANTFELAIPVALAPRMRPVFHASELIPYETRVLEPLVDVPPHDQAQHNSELLEQDEEEILQALQLLRRPDTRLTALPAREPGTDDPAEWFSLQAVTTQKLLPRSGLQHQNVRFHPTIRVAYLPAKLPFTPDNTLLREQDEGLVLSALLATSPAVGPTMHNTALHHIQPLAPLHELQLPPPPYLHRKKR